MLDGRMIWCDTETFGLVPSESPIIELGFIITDLDLIEIDRWDILVWDSPMYDGLLEYMMKNPDDDGSGYVLNMHAKNGLWKDARENGFTVGEAEDQANDWLESHGIRGGKEALCGSSIGFDSNMLDYWMPTVRKRFHYRVMDVTSYKMYLAAKYPAHCADLPPSKEAHRVLADCRDTIDEFKFYERTFLGLPS